jgi:hypothetical protein
MQNDPQHNVARVNTLREDVVAHPMCGRLEESSGRITVIYPVGYFFVDGLTIQTTAGKAAAFQYLLERMEQEWLGSFPGALVES